MSYVAADYAQEAHKQCTTEHSWDKHMFTSSYYLGYLTGKGIRVTPKQLIDAIVAIAGSPKTESWTRHPHPDRIIEYLNENNAPASPPDEG